MTDASHSATSGASTKNRSFLTQHIISRSQITALRKGHSITSSARPSSESGTVRPKCLGSREIDGEQLELSGFDATTRNLAKIVQKVAQIVAHGTAASLFVSCTKHPIN
jgi:hypothetical protein